MAQHKSAIRQLRRSLRRNATNRTNRSTLRTHVKQLREAIKSKDGEKAKEFLPLVISQIDKTAKKGAIHRNKGNRYKSRLSKQVELLNSTSSK